MVVVVRDRCGIAGVAPEGSSGSSGESLEVGKVDCLGFVAEGVGDLTALAAEFFSEIDRGVVSMGQGSF